MKRIQKKRAVYAAVLIALLLTTAVGGTLAYLSTQSTAVQNEFRPTEVTCKVNEPGWEDGSTTKSNVSIQNVGDVPAYIRAAIVVTWQDGNGNVLGQAPVPGTDYTLSIGSGWSKGSDGFYYYRTPVPAGDSTGVLIESCQVTAAAPAAGYTLHVEVLGSAIQAEGGAVTLGADGVWTINQPNR